jgi:hypothetical protein
MPPLAVSTEQPAHVVQYIQNRVSQEQNRIDKEKNQVKLHKDLQNKTRDLYAAVSRRIRGPSCLRITTPPLPREGMI